MGKRYHCEYCNKSFPYTVAMRKKHDAGLVHQKLKDAHYRQFADARTRLQEELLKTPCRRFQSGMPCSFGEDCKFSHLLPYQLEELRQAAEREEVLSSIRFPSQLLRKKQPSVEDFVSKIESLVKESQTQPDI